MIQIQGTDYNYASLEDKCKESPSFACNTIINQADRICNLERDLRRALQRIRFTSDDLDALAVELGADDPERRELPPEASEPCDPVS